jgi:hypothetical protein
METCSIQSNSNKSKMLKIGARAKVRTVAERARVVMWVGSPNYGPLNAGFCFI